MKNAGKPPGTQYKKGKAPLGSASRRPKWVCGFSIEFPLVFLRFWYYYIEYHIEYYINIIVNSILNNFDMLCIGKVKNMDTPIILRYYIGNYIRSCIPYNIPYNLI